MARYSEEIIDEIRQSNDIVDVISQYMNLKRSGRNYFGLCPFHNEKSPSFSVSPDKQIFHCFGCGVGGNVITFIMKIEGCGFVEAVQILAEKANIQLPTLENNIDSKREELKAKVYKVNEFTADFYHKNLYTPNAKLGQEYVKKRMLTNDTLKNYQIGFSGKFNELYNALKKQGFEDAEILESGLVNRNDNGQYIDRYRNRLMFPICDVRGRVIAFGGRVLDDSKPKYINSPENVVYSKGRNLFGLNVAKKYETKQLLIVEGYMDVISLHQRGVKNVVGALGTALTQQQGFLLRKNAEKVIAERFPNFNFSTLDWGELDPFYLEHPEEIPIEHEFIGYRQEGDVAEDYQGNLYLVLCDPGIHPIGSVCMEQSELDDAVKLGKREDYTGELLEEIPE